MYKFLNEIYTYNQLESTNKYLKEHHTDFKTGDVMIAKEQTKGYGTRNRHWSSTQGMGLYLSLLLKHHLDINEYQHLTDIGTKAVASTLYTLGLNPKIIPPNDILINQKKISGILTETFNYQNITISVLGIGLNLYQNQSDFDLKDDRNTPTSLKLEGIVMDYKEILSLVLKELDSELINFLDSIS